MLMCYNNVMKSKGFTLIELMVVISIVGMLSSVVLVNVNQARAKGRDAARIQQVGQLDMAIKSYVLDKNSSPLCQAQSSGTVTRTAASACFAVSSGGTSEQSNNWSLLAGQINPYISNIPNDVCSGGCAANNGGITGYTYSGPLALQYACQVANDGDACPLSEDELNQMYQICANLETSSVPAGNCGGSGGGSGIVSPYQDLANYPIALSGWSSDQGLMTFSEAINKCKGVVDGYVGWMFPTQTLISSAFMNHFQFSQNLGFVQNVQYFFMIDSVTPGLIWWDYIPNTMVAATNKAFPGINTNPSGHIRCYKP